VVGLPDRRPPGGMEAEWISPVRNSGIGFIWPAGEHRVPRPWSRPGSPSVDPWLWREIVGFPPFQQHAMDPVSSSGVQEHLRGFSLACAECSPAVSIVHYAISSFVR